MLQNPINTAIEMDHYDLLKVTQRKQGMGRLKMGALLVIIKENDGWKGRGGNSFRQFLLEHGIEPKAALQYMCVAKCFVIDYRLSIQNLERIALASMRNLCFAASIAKPENVENIIDILASLPRPEAYEELQKLAPRIGKFQPASPVNKILDQVSNLTLDDRASLFTKIGLTKHQPPISNSM